MRSSAVALSVGGRGVVGRKVPTVRRITTVSAAWYSVAVVRLVLAGGIQALNGCQRATAEATWIVRGRWLGCLALHVLHRVRLHGRVARVLAIQRLLRLRLCRWLQRRCLLRLCLKWLVSRRRVWVVSLLYSRRTLWACLSGSMLRHLTSMCLVRLVKPWRVACGSGYRAVSTASARACNHWRRPTLLVVVISSPGRRRAACSV